MSEKMSENLNVRKNRKMSEKMSEIHNLDFTLPEDWKWVRLGEVCDEIYRYPTYYNIEYISEGIPEIRGELIKGNGILESDLAKYRFISKETSQRYPRTVLKEGDFVLSVRGSMGKIAIVPKELEGANMTANLIRISPDRAIVHSPFFKHVFLSEYFQKTLNDLSPQTTIKTIKAPVLKSIKLPLPPFPEQQRIAAKIQDLMQEVERARAACEKQLEAANALPAAYLREVFESEEAMKWDRRRLGEVSDVIMGQSPPGYTYNAEGKGLPFYQGKIEFGEVYVKPPSTWCIEPKKISEPNDILISVRAPVGPTNMCNIKCCIGRGLSALRTRNNIESRSLFYYLRYLEPEISMIGQGSTFSAISKSQIQNLEIRVPSLPIQQRIAAKLKEKMAEVEKLRTSIEKQLEAINFLPQAILIKAFKGEL